MTPLMLPVPLCNRHKWSAVVPVFSQGMPEMELKPPLAASAMEADVPPIKAAVPVPQVEPVPSISETFCAVALIRTIEHIFSLALEVIRSVEEVWLMAILPVQEPV